MPSSFQHDLYQLAVGVLYLNLGRAGLEFPTTTKAHPSYEILVTLTPGDGVLTASHKRLFPFLVKWNLWENVVVPLFAEKDVLVKVGEDTNETLRQQINREYLATRNYDTLIAKIQERLLGNLIAAGFLPAGTTELGLVAEQAAPGEPVARPPGTNDGSPYTRFD